MNDSISSNHLVSKFTHMQQTVNEAGSIKDQCDSNLDYFKTKDNSNVNPKSFVEQSIERLYGPGALGIGFRLRKSIEQQNNNLIKDNKTNEDISRESTSPSSKVYPSVFRHLRPEFRYQLPVKNGTIFHTKSSPKHGSISSQAKLSFQSVKCKEIEGPIVRHIPIVLEDEESHKARKIITKDSLVVVDLNSNIKNDPPKIVLLNSKEEVQDGNYFLKVVDNEVRLLNTEVKKLEEDLANTEGKVSDDIQGRLLSTVGKIKLLVSKKIKQFTGLCEKNIKVTPTGELPTTNDDLAGFWDMVCIQIDSLKSLVKEINQLRDNNWKEVQPVKQLGKIQSKTGRPKSKAVAKVDHSMQDAKAETRKKVMEERRKAMREAMNAKRKEANNTKGSNNGVEIFIANES